MITHKKKNEKTTEIYFDETPVAVVIRTHNTALKKRLLAFAEKFPDLCRLTDDDELGYLSFEIDKDRFSIRLTAPYTEERKAMASTPPVMPPIRKSPVPLTVKSI